MIASLPWWGWILAAVVFWLASVLADETRWLFRLAMIAGMILCALIGIIRFVKWVWSS